jgi:hypothetical protein
MWIIQSTKKVALWNNQHFEEKNRDCAACLNYPVFIFIEIKYIKCSILKVAVHLSYIYDAVFLKFKHPHSSSFYQIFFRVPSDVFCDFYLPLDYLYSLRFCDITLYLMMWKFLDFLITPVVSRWEFKLAFKSLNIRIFHFIFWVSCQREERSFVLLFISWH